MPERNPPSVVLGCVVGDLERPVIRPDWTQSSAYSATASDTVRAAAGRTRGSVTSVINQAFHTENGAG